MGGGELFGTVAGRYIRGMRQDDAAVDASGAAGAVSGPSFRGLVMDSGTA